MAVRIRLTWSDNSAAETGHNIYRSGAPMDPEALPAPLATLAADVVEYLDEGVTEGQTYYYRVGAFNSSEELVSAEVAVVAVANTRPVFVSVASSVSTSAAFSATLPAGWLPGQLAILHVSSITSTLATPSGWNLVGSHISSGGGAVVTSALFWRVLQVGDSGPSIEAGTNRSAVIWTFEAGTFNATTPVVQIATGTTGGLSSTASVGASSSVAAGQHYQMQLLASGGNFSTISTYPYTSAQHTRGIGSDPNYSRSTGCGANFDGGVSAGSNYTLSANTYWVSRKIAIIGLGHNP